MSVEESARVAEPASGGAKEGLVFPSLKIPFILLLLCFAAWGSFAELTTVLVGVFKLIFKMTNFQSAMVQVAYFGAYFSMAIPAAMINKRFGYKTGVLTGLTLAAVGGLLFFPAGKLLSYAAFLVVYFVLAAGLSILETSANPFVIAMGPEGNATQRLNLAQAFNPIGANIGVLMGTLLVLGKVTDESAKKNMNPQQLAAAQQHDVSVSVLPYLGIAVVLLVIGVFILVRKMENPLEQQEHETSGARPHSQKGVLGRLFRNRHYRYGVLAQFFNVGAQVCTWSFTIQYAREIVGISKYGAGWFLQSSLLLFLVSRFVMTYLLGKFRPTKLLLIMAAVGVGLALIAVLSPNLVGLLAVVAISLSLSLMFPTIYGVALHGLREDTKFGAAGLVMAILGGALLPPVFGLVADISNQAVAFVVPAACFALIAGYALFDLKADPEGSELVSEAHH